MITILLEFRVLRVSDRCSIAAHLGLRSSGELLICVSQRL